MFYARRNTSAAAAEDIGEGGGEASPSIRPYRHRLESRAVWAIRPRTPNLSNGIQLWPAFMIRRTMFAPVLPRPIMPSCISSLLVTPSNAAHRFPSGLCVPFAVRLRSAEPEVQDVQIADRRQDEGMMNAETIGDDSLE